MSLTEAVKESVSDSSSTADESFEPLGSGLFGLWIRTALSERISEMLERRNEAEEEKVWASLSNQAVELPILEPLSDRRPVTPAPKRQSPSIAVAQEWEGYVTSIGDKLLEAALVDLSAGDSEETHLAEIPLNELSADDRSRLEIGSVFRWIISIERDGSTQRRVSQITLRHLPAWTEREIGEQKAKAEQLASQLHELSSSEPSR